jgi:hypothetical protein
MSRIRSVHPGFFRDERLVQCSAFARLLFIGLGVDADDKGIFEWKPLTLKMTIFPGDNLDIIPLLEELEAADAVRRYEIAGRQYGAIRNFRKFQRPKTPNDIHPMPPDIGIYVYLPGASSEVDADEAGQFPPKGETPPPAGEKPFQMEEVGGKREEEKHISLEGERDFDEWYAVYPRHVGRGQARKAYRAARRKADAAQLLAGAKSAAREFGGKEPQYIPHPATWLNGERWDDDKTSAAAAAATRRDKNGNLPGDALYGVSY